MTKIKYDIDAMKFMSMLESMTHAKLRDCIISDNLVTFVVDEGEIGKAVGRKGANVRMLENKLKKKMKIVEFSEDLARFIENLAYPAKVKEVQIEDKIVKVTAEDSQSRGLLIGRGAVILRAYEAIVKRFFDVEEIKVV